jgi:hypothetical protein
MLSGKDSVAVYLLAALFDQITIAIIGSWSVRLDVAAN